MRIVRNLELHVTHACNLTCESCSHYSNQGHKGNLPLGEAAEWIGFWNRRIEPQVFSLLGGEPTIHPDLPEFVVLTRRLFPSAHIRIVTNGFFLHRHPNLPRVMREMNNVKLNVSIHHLSTQYYEKLKPVAELIDTWIKEYKICVSIYESNRHWTRRYLGFGTTMQPYEDGEPRRSWERCPARYCMQLFEGKIWKCAPLAYLKLQQAKYGLSPSWDPYLRYEPLRPDCSDRELDEFVSREDESSCGMCPANPERFDLPTPLRT